MNLQTLFTALKHHYPAYYCAAGDVIDNLIDDLLASGHSKKLIKRICRYAYFV
jgi:hypothetical protein